MPLSTISNFFQAMPSEHEMGVPSETSVAEKTIEEPANDVDLIGEYTDRLSDLSEDEEEALFPSQKAYFATWLQRLRPLVQNKNVRAFSITNLLLIFINIIFCWWLLVSSSMLWFNSYGLTKLPTRKTMCYEFFSSANKYAPCPENLSELEDIAPCNTHVCAKNLSQFNWKMDKSGEKEAIYYVNVKDPTEGCYKIRDIPTDDQLVFIDTTELISMVDCNIPVNGLASGNP
uniref:Uncharacterized protein n=1 Tax=Ditylenchus dipsaci TaxID=166011 RepID=A0A915CWU9_9BILA